MVGVRERLSCRPAEGHVVCKSAVIYRHKSESVRARHAAVCSSEARRDYRFLSPSFFSTCSHPSGFTVSHLLPDFPPASCLTICFPISPICPAVCCATPPRVLEAFPPPSFQSLLRSFPRSLPPSPRKYTHILSLSLIPNPTNFSTRNSSGLLNLSLLSCSPISRPTAALTPFAHFHTQTSPALMPLNLRFPLPHSVPARSSLVFLWQGSRRWWFGRRAFVATQSIGAPKWTAASFARLPRLCSLDLLACACACVRAAGCRQRSLARPEPR